MKVALVLDAAPEKSTVSQSKKSIAFTPDQAQFCEMHTLTGSHPTASSIRST